MGGIDAGGRGAVELVNTRSEILCVAGRNVKTREESLDKSRNF